MLCRWVMMTWYVSVSGVTSCAHCCNRELRDLYSQLVDGGILLAEEFWQGQEALVRRETGRAASGQRPGLSSAMLEDVQTSADGRTETVRASALPVERAAVAAAAADISVWCVHGRATGLSALFAAFTGRHPERGAWLCAQVRIRLTPELIHQTFAEKPWVRRAFVAQVPHNMTEKAFWTKYLRQQAKEKVPSPPPVAPAWRLPCSCRTRVIQMPFR